MLKRAITLVSFPNNFMLKSNLLSVDEDMPPPPKTRRSAIVSLYLYFIYVANFYLQSNVTVATSTDSSALQAGPSQAESMVSFSATSRPSEGREFQNKDLPIAAGKKNIDIFNGSFVASVCDYVGRSINPWTSAKEMDLNLLNSLWSEVFPNDPHTIVNSTTQDPVYSIVS